MPHAQQPGRQSRVCAAVPLDPLVGPSGASEVLTCRAALRAAFGVLSRPCTNALALPVACRPCTYPHVCILYQSCLPALLTQQPALESIVDPRVCTQLAWHGPAGLHRVCSAQAVETPPERGKRVRARAFAPQDRVSSQSQHCLGSNMCGRAAAAARARPAPPRHLPGRGRQRAAVPPVCARPSPGPRRRRLLSGVVVAGFGSCDCRGCGCKVCGGAFLRNCLSVCLIVLSRPESPRRRPVMSLTLYVVVGAVRSPACGRQPVPSAPALAPSPCTAEQHASCCPATLTFSCGASAAPPGLVDDTTHAAHVHLHPHAPRRGMKQGHGAPHPSCLSHISSQRADLQ